jgi:malic enzyme
VVESIEQQVQRTLEQLRTFDKPINKYIYLNSLQRTNQTLFYATLAADLEGCLPIVYTPTGMTAKYRDGESRERGVCVWGGLSLMRVVLFFFRGAVGEACQKFAHIMRGMQGLYISAEHDRGEVWLPCQCGDVSATVSLWGYCRRDFAFLTAVPNSCVQIQSIIQNWPVDDVDIIVVTDGSRILGLGCVFLILLFISSSTAFRPSTAA